jgi:hypothetical protein
MSKGYNTNLAAEFYVLSVLHRLGMNANLTLGNKKSVDIAVIRDAGDALTVDVKGLAGKTCWPIDNFRERERHFLVLVCYLGKISEPSIAPEVYIVPSDAIPSLTYSAPGGRKTVELSTMRKRGAHYKDAWTQLS